MPYNTKQQQAILACLAARKQELLTAGELNEALRQSGNPVGLATIYRQLEKLVQNGQVHKIPTDEGAFYQYCDPCHDRRDCFLLKCECCGRVLHLDCSHLKPLYQHLETHHHFIIHPGETIFSGLCDVCAAHRKEDPAWKPTI